MNLKKTIIIITLLATYSLYSQTVNDTKNILYLNSYHQGYQWADMITMGIEDGIDGNNIELDIEYLDTKRTFSTEYKSRYLNLLEYKHSDRHYDLIITSDNNAFDLVYNNRKTFGSDIPIVFCGINFVEYGIYENQNITGINEDIEIAANIELIKGMYPNTDNIYIITDNTITGKIVQKEVVKFSETVSSVNIVPLFNKSMEELIKIVGELKENDIVFFTNFALDSKGNYYSTSAATRFITRASKVPVFGAWHFQIDHGIIGGLVVSGYEQGYTAAQLAVEILNGKAADEIPIIYQSKKKLYFDYTAMKKFGITNRELPENSTIINVPNTYYREHREIIIIAILIIIILVIIIFIFAATLIQSRISKSRLTKFHNELIEKNEEMSNKLKDTLKVLDTGNKLASIKDRSTHLQNSLNKSADLIASFKDHKVENEYKYINLNRFITDLVENNFSKYNNLIDIVPGVVTEEFKTYPGVLETIIKNIIENSIFHGICDLENRKITIEYSYIDGVTTIDIADNGKGISSEAIKKIYEPFFTTIENDEYRGLGLHIVKRLSEQVLNADLTCDSRLGEGTKFSITFTA